MNDMRKLMEIVDRPDDEVAYIAAKLYLSHPGLRKHALASRLSELANVDAPTAMMMIDAIDAYEDLREAPDAWEM